MNDKNNTSLNTPEKNNTGTKEKSVVTKKPFKWSTLFIIIALFLAAASAAGAAYIWLQFEQYKQQSNTAITNALNDVSSQLKQKLGMQDIPQHVSPLLSPLHSQLDVMEQNSIKASQARKTLTESTQKLFELYGRDKNGWQLAEVEYLLRIAQHRLVIENDFQGAEKTLKAADEKISEIADPGLLPIRIAISDERVLLQSRKRPDLVGIVLSLSRITKQIPLLDLSLNQLKEPTVVKPSGMSETIHNPNAPWQQQVTQFIKGLVKVEPLKKSISTPVVNLINVINTLEENLKLAKWAVLERDQKQYQQLLKQSSKLFKQYFDANNNHHAEINTELKRLTGLEIRPRLPDISGSLIMLKKIMIKKEHKVTEPEPEPKPKPKLEPITTPQTITAIEKDTEEEKGDSNE